MTKEYKKSPLYQGLDNLSFAIAIAGIAIGVGVAKSDNDLGEGLEDVAEAITEFNTASNAVNSVTLQCAYDGATVPSDYAIHPDITDCLKQKEMIERNLGETIQFEIIPE